MSSQHSLKVQNHHRITEIIKTINMFKYKPHEI